MPSRAIIVIVGEDDDQQPHLLLDVRDVGGPAEFVLEGRIGKADADPVRLACDEYDAEDMIRSHAEASGNTGANARLVVWACRQEGMPTGTLRVLDARFEDDSDPREPGGDAGEFAAEFDHRWACLQAA